MKPGIFFAPLLMALAQTPGAEAMTVEVKGNVVYATGPVEDDLRKFQSAMAAPGVDTVALVNSPGGDLWTALTIGRLIAGKGLKTVAAGYCHSACSVIFMGGRERRFADAFRPVQNVVGIHGAHNKDTKQINPVVQAQMFAFYKQGMGERFNAAVMNQALYQMDDEGAMLRVFETTRNSKALVYHCRSGQSLRRDCAEFKGEDALTLGVVTHADLARLDLPPSFREAAKLLGRELELPIEDMAGFLSAVAERGCRSEACKTNVQTWAAKSDNKSIASRLEGPGIGWSWDHTTPNSALISAVYGCNHIKGSPVALCEAQGVNGFDLRPMQDQSDAAHKEALGKVAPPRDRFYANEEFGGGFTSATGLRMQKLSDITPQRLDGIRTVGTLELARLLTSASAPAIVDVLGGSIEVLPGSATLLRGGFAFDEPAKESEYNTRFLALLGLLAPDKSKAVVFYCAGRNCWHSVNAALRAKKGGYSDVLWYRGGLESWQAAHLPTAPIAIRAVAD